MGHRHRKKESSGVQQRSQPRQTNNELSLLELGVVRMKRFDDGATMSKNLMSTGQQAQRDVRNKWAA